MFKRLFSTLVLSVLVLSNICSRPQSFKKLIFGLPYIKSGESGTAESSFVS